MREIKRYWIHAIIVVAGIAIMAVGNLIYPDFSKYCCIGLVVILNVIFAKIIFRKIMEDDQK
jgi:hypothetical protein